MSSAAGRTGQRSRRPRPGRRGDLPLCLRLPVHLSRLGRPVRRALPDVIDGVSVMQPTLVDPGASRAETPSYLGAGERDRTADLPFTRSTAPCAVRASCTDGDGHRTDSTRCAGIIRRAVPRTVPRPRALLTVALLLCVTPRRALYPRPFGPGLLLPRRLATLAPSQHPDRAFCLVFVRSELRCA